MGQSAGLSAPTPSAAPSRSGAAPPPPPPPPSFTELFADIPTNVNAPPVDLHAKLAAELNKGAEITKGLRKVTDDQKTHKNTSLRAGNTVPGEVKKSENSSSVKSNSSQAKPPKLELIDKKWVVVS